MANRTGAQQKAALTRVVNRWIKAGRPQQGRDEDTSTCDAVRVECQRTVAEWELGAWLNGPDRGDGVGKYGRVRPGCWPDNWSSWQRALDDCYPVFQGPDLRKLWVELLEAELDRRDNERCVL